MGAWAIQRARDWNAFQLDSVRSGPVPDGLGAADGADGRAEVFPTAIRSPMPIDAAKALAAEPRTGEITWDHKDVQLYHLGIGAGIPATDPDELRYTLESRLHVLPSFATVAGAGKPGVTGGLSMPGIDVDLARVLHGGQSLVIHRPIPATGTATATNRIAAVYDKGKGGRPRAAYRSRRRRRPVVDQRRPDLHPRRGRLGRRPRPVRPARSARR
ncbi:hypothetical protein GCM10011428_17520 [Streptomyces violaceus]